MGGRVGSMVHHSRNLGELIGSFRVPSTVSFVDEFFRVFFWDMFESRKMSVKQIHVLFKDIQMYLHHEKNGIICSNTHIGSMGLVYLPMNGRFLNGKMYIIV